MTTIIIIPAAETDWAAQGRLAGDTDLPLNEAGHGQAIADGQALLSAAPAAIHAGPEEATKQTGSIIAHELRQKLKTSKDLRELDLGHWEGLTEDDFRERFSKVYKQWRNDPLAVSPPEGESVADATARLSAALEKILKGNSAETVVVVLGRFAAAIARCQFGDDGYGSFWQYVDAERARHVIPVPKELPAEGRPGPSETKSD